MTTYAVAPNDRTSFYEIHKAGCRHLALGKFPYSVPKEGDTAAAVAAAWEAANEGCLTKIAACAK